ncbi:hypothetical protein PHYSODRAFT_472110 [Phytophthora sojae]|uniref:Fatty acid hydroxylase domain-containing protein n=1 Tax=Phytophthora sojae (strain P6497) TaxID=1094619 RepID=G4YK45_PHYSP|nr:hypothetical protein PHYSODRAFT_472110 [Phytophthora sojae]EGZ27807.1 hypothetical protein PHYSODRAFT_472110 [Phytophthora sojae]|eukprot:XP_009515082.1 hypothetical protein PHYSODRAFT_472110 [Phytophthora sojae]
MLQLFARRFKYYALVNTFICSVGLGSYLAVSYVDSLATGVGVGVVYVASLLRILAMVKWFEMVSTTKAKIHGPKRVQLTQEQSAAIYRRIFMLAVPTECISFWFAQQTIAEDSVDWRSFLTEYAWFVPKSLLFEVLFDLFHYCMHWTCHSSAWLYQHVHKQHHLHLHPCPLSTYEQDGVDLFLTNMLPFFLAWSLSFPFSAFQLHLLFAYKTYVEVAGHSGLEVKGFSFPQMPLLNNVTSICLRVHDHDLHHTHPRWNFAKRFSLWDKVFGTFRPGRPLTEKYH